MPVTIVEMITVKFAPGSELPYRATTGRGLHAAASSPAAAVGMIASMMAARDDTPTTPEEE